MKIPPVEVELFHANGRLDRHDDTSIRYFVVFHLPLIYQIHHT